MRHTLACGEVNAHSATAKKLAPSNGERHEQLKKITLSGRGVTQGCCCPQGFSDAAFGKNAPISQISRPDLGLTLILTSPQTAYKSSPPKKKEKGYA